MCYICGMNTRTEQRYSNYFSPFANDIQKDSKEIKEGLRTLTEVRDCKLYYPLYGACLDAKKKVSNHLDSRLQRIHELGEETKSRRVYKNDIKAIFLTLPRYKGVRDKMAAWTNIKAPKEVEKLPLYREIRRVIRLLLIRNKDKREKAIIRFNPLFSDVEISSTTEIFLASLGFYVFDMLKMEELLLVYKDKLLELFRREISILNARGFAKFVKDTQELYPESFYLDDYSHFKCYDKTKSREEKIKAAREEREIQKMKIVESYFKMVINPNVVSQYFKKTGGNKPKLLEGLNERLVKKGFKPVKERTLNKWKKEIFEKYSINIKEILKADKSLYKEHTKVRKEFTKKRMTMKERVDIICFVLQGKDPSEMDVIAYYSQHLPPWQRIDTWSVPIDNLYPS